MGGGSSPVEETRYRAPQPPPHLLQPAVDPNPLTTHSLSGEAVIKEGGKSYGNKNTIEDDACFMADLAAEIKANAPYSRSNPLKTILTENKIKRAYSIAGTDAAVAESLGIGKSTAARMRMLYR